jgi:hypothetical protein
LSSSSPPSSHHHFRPRLHKWARHAVFGFLSMAYLIQHDDPSIYLQKT